MRCTCTFCPLMTGASGRREGPGKCKLTVHNLTGAKVLLKKLHPQHADAMDQLELSECATLCFQCLPERERSKISMVRNGKLTTGEILVDPPAVQWGYGEFGSRKVRSSIVVAGGIHSGYVVKWKGAVDDAHGELETLSAAAANDAVKFALWLRAPEQSSAAQHAVLSTSTWASSMGRCMSARHESLQLCISEITTRFLLPFFTCSCI